MKILLSSHQDTVQEGYNLSFENGEHKGMIDNFGGILLTYLTLYSEENLIRFEKEGKIKIWHSKGEEWGRLDNAPEMDKDDIILVVDCADLPHYDEIDFSIENISGFSEDEVVALKEDLQWQGFKVSTKMMDKNCGDDEDESWKWEEKGYRTMSFTVPIDCGLSRGWHRHQQDNSVSLEKMNICKKGLKRVLCHLLG